MFTQKRDFLCVGLLSVVVLFGVSAWAQIASDDADPLTFAVGTRNGSRGGTYLQSIPQGPQGATGTNGNGFNDRAASDSAPAYAANNNNNDDAAVHDDALGQNFTPRMIKNEVTNVGANPYSADNNLPPAMTVRTATLLELHKMRQSAVALCIQLPTKYRTRLPQCADIFQHEIRLTELAKQKQ